MSPSDEGELHRAGAVASGRDDLDEFLEEELRDPAFRAAYQDAEARNALLRVLVTQRSGSRISQAEVAARMGTTQSAVSDLERGATDPRLSTLQRYARAVGCRLRLMLQAYRPRRPDSWHVHVHELYVDRGSALPEAWEELWSHLASGGQPRPTQLGAASTTVAPVELRAVPDEFAQAAVR